MQHESRLPTAPDTKTEAERWWLAYSFERAWLYPCARISIGQLRLVERLSLEVGTFVPPQL